MRCLCTMVIPLYMNFGFTFPSCLNHSYITHLFNLTKGLVFVLGNLYEIKITHNYIASHVNKLKGQFVLNRQWYIDRLLSRVNSFQAMQINRDIAMALHCCKNKRSFVLCEPIFIRPYLLWTTHPWMFWWKNDLFGWHSTLISEMVYHKI
jgi:hypothetical protein